jgi:uncharacterized membrane protein
MPALWEFFFKYPPVVFEKGRLLFTSPLPGWMLFAATAAVMVLVVWTYLRARGKARARDRVVLVALRALTFAVLLFALFRPALQVAAAVDQENYLGVLIDDSRSMQIADGPDGTRSSQVKTALDAENSPLLKSLAERYRLRLFRFSGAAERIGGVGEMTFTGGQSRLGHALDQARAQLAGVPLAGMVVITDGADQAEADLNSSVLGLRAGSVPVFTVGVGREEFARDIEVRRVSTPRTVLKGASLVVDVVIAQNGYRGQTVPLVVEDEGRVVSTQNVTLPLDGTPTAVRLHFTANEPGTRRFRFRVAPQAGELVPQNNQQDAVIEVTDAPAKILYFEGEPRFEVKFLRRAVENDPQLQLVVLQRTAEGKFLRLGVDSASELVSGFPTTREELFTYRGLIIGSVEASFFSRDQMRLIADFVAERGGGLLMLGGRRAFSEGGYAGTPIAAALPVELQEGADTTFFAEEKVAPTRAGIAHAALQLAANPDSSRERWATLPELSTFNRVTRLKPGASALLTGSGADLPAGQIVLASQRYGRGLALALPVQDTWIWQMHADISLEDQTHETFWKQLLRWLVSDVPDQLTLTSAADHAALRQPMVVQADLRDAAYKPVNNGQVIAHIDAPDGSSRAIPMVWSPKGDGAYQVSFTPTLPGKHSVRVEAKSGTMSKESTLVLDAAEDDGEFFGAQMRAPLLKRIAEETGGRFYTMANVGRLPEEIRYAGQGITQVEQKDLWDMPIVFLLIIGFVGAEWGYRRMRGLP